MKNIYRIRVEQIPQEEFQRFYPEVSYDNDGTFINTQLPIEIRWYKSEEECRNHIDNLKKLETNYTIKYINIE
jgi:hypothetical protein